MLTRLQRVLEEDRIIPVPWWEKPFQVDPGLGVKGIRSTEFPCEAYDPGEPSGDCHTDGHYLCIECKNLDPKCDYAHDECEACKRARWDDRSCKACGGSGLISRLTPPRRP